MNTIPDVIFFEILSYLSYEDQCDFGMINVGSYNLILKRIRRIRMEKKLLAAKHREKLYRILFDPYHQLRFDVSDLGGTIDGLIENSFLYLSTTAEFFVSSLIHHVKKVQKLRLHCPGMMSKSLNENRLEETLTSWINNNPSSAVKELSINNYDIIHLTAIQNLQSLEIIGARNLQINGLHIPGYCNLQTLRIINCSGIDDVSCLGRIHELHLIQCQGIRDISCLNNNHKIVIKECEKILDYSKSFRYSKMISIEFYSKDNISLDFSQLMEVKDFMINVPFQTKNLLFPQCRTLRNVSLTSLNTPFTLPAGNAIREIKVSMSPGFKSLINFGQIYWVSLRFLAITSLDGLGSGNRIVEIRSCNNITDFSPLRHCDKVIIRQCGGFKEASQLRGVKEFIFSPVQRQMIPEDLEGVTCFSLTEFPNDLFSLKLPTSVKKIEINNAWSLSIIKFPFSWLGTLPSNITEVQLLQVTKACCREIELKCKKESEIAFSINCQKNGIQFVRKQN